MTNSQPARRSRAFWRRSPRNPSKPCVRSFSMICSVAHSQPTPTTQPSSKPGNCWIEREMPGWSLTSTGRERRLANAPCLRQKICPRPFAGWMTSVLLATKGASGERWCAPAPSLVRPIVSNGSAHSATGATVANGRNCVRASGPSVATSLRSRSRRSVPCCGWMDNMGPVPSSPIWLAFPS